MNIQWENIRWETDDAGTSWATLADDEHNMLRLENRGSNITFHTDGDPSFDAGTLLDIATLCLLLSRNALDKTDAVGEGRSQARVSQTRPSDVNVPEPRRASMTQHDATWTGQGRD
jgi:hypothetical protein